MTKGQPKQNNGQKLRGKNTGSQNKRWAVFSRLLRLMLAYPVRLAAIIVFALSGNLLLLAGPKLMGQAIDLLLKQGLSKATLLGLSLKLLAIYLLAALLQWLMTRTSSLLAADLVGGLRRNIYERINLLPLEFFHKTPFGSLTSRVSTDMDLVNSGLVTGLPQMFSGLVSLVGSIYFMFSISWRVALLIMGLTPLIYLVSWTISKNSYHMYSLETDQRAKLNGYAEEYIDRPDLARTLKLAAPVEANYQEQNQLLYTYGQKAQFYSSLTNPSTRLVNALSFILCGGLGTLLAIRGDLSLGQVGSLLFYTNQFSKPINQITEIVSQLQAALAAAAKIFELMDQETTEIDPEGLADLKVSQGQIDFRDVSFSYEPGQELIKDLNIQVPARAKVAIVGPTGAGKTTLVNLLMRFYELDGGQILIDGQDISQVTRSSLRRSFGMVLQEVWLFRGTVLENLTFGGQNLDRKRVEEVCRQIEADGFIRRLSQGYDTVLDKHNSLSQGQQQLLTIARVMLQDPVMLILDEATSDIDTVTELRVQKAFDLMLQGRTSFVIAHRLSTILDADLILVMAEGKIVEQGNFKSLMAQDGLFNQLYHSQFDKARS